jgi:Spy/CpxP family protein refolding chaperone
MKSYNKGTIIGALIGGAFGLALTIGAVAFASPHGPHAKGHHWTPEKMEEHLTEMTERLSLSTAQEAQIRTIMEQARSRAQEIKEMPRGPEKFTAFRDLRFATEDQIYANLSCDQREQLRLLKREHKAERMQQHRERRQADDTK